MAIYHLSTQVIGRSSGKSAVASAAYRSGEKMYDEHTGLAFDYTRKQNIDHTEILAPDHAPAWVQDRETLWNQVELVERRKDAQLARELNIALPKELSQEQQIELVQNFSKEQFVSKGMIADIAFHNLKGENPHTHIMLTTREIMPEGFGKKNRDWNNRELHNEWRKEWANHANKALEKAGSLERIDHRSLEDQGIDRVPQIHVGPIASAMEKRGVEKGVRTDRGEQNRKIIDLNEFRERHRKQVKELNEDIKEFNAEDRQFKAQKKEQPQLQQPKPQEPDLNEKIEDARQEVNQSYEEMTQQKQSVSGLNHEIDRLKYKLHDLDVTENFLQITEENLKAIRFNPFKRAEIKELQKSIDHHKQQIKITLGGDSRESLVQQLREKEKKIPKEEGKLAEAETRFTRAKHNFDDLSKKKKKLDHEQELDKCKALHTRMMAGEKLTLKEYKVLSSHAKELEIHPNDLPKIPKAKNVDLVEER